MPDLPNCPDCGVKPGEFHQGGCDVERCPMCGGQRISCGCNYRFCGMDLDTFYLAHRAPWSGEWPGKLECREFNWWSKMVTGRGWVSCSKDDPEAHENLNRLGEGECRWDIDRQRFVLRETNGHV